MKSRWAVLASLGLLLAACGNAAEPTTTTDAGATPASTPEAVFAELVDALQRDDLEPVAGLTDHAQLPLLALAEGLDVRSVADLTAADRTAIATNFWQGFAEQLRASIGVDLSDLRIESIERISVDDAEFAAVELVYGRDASVRRVVLRNGDAGWVVDLIASFPSPLLGQIPNAAQLIRSTGDPALSDSLRGYESSVRFVLEDPALDPLLNQAGTAALESIIR